MTAAPQAATRVVAALGAALVAAFAACSPGPPAQPPSASSATSVAGTTVANGAVVPIGPRPLRGEPEGGSPRRAEAPWQQALAGDPLSVRALAHAAGATGLLEGVEDGGALFDVACEALPFADDADIALGRLAEIALLDDAALSSKAVVAIHRIAAKGPARGESLDPDGVTAAARAVMALASNATLPPDRRARAISAARAFAERGALDPATIPADLDPAPSSADAP
ncbi:MAG: thiamine biosynthesis protein [Polyangiaceae bacterium]